MSEKQDGVGRRVFLKSGLVAAASTAVMSSAQARSARTGKGESGDGRPIPIRKFGKTGLSLPILGMGGSAMVDQWAASYGVKLPDIDERAAMVRHAYDRGVRYFDTARVYSESESIVGRGLKDVRKEIFLATKVAVYRPESVRRSLEKSLEELGMERADLVQIHSPTIEAIGFKGAMKIHAELLKLRDEKLFRYIGVTTHVAFENVYKMISTGGFDQVLLAYGYFNKGMDTLLSHRNLEWRSLCLAKAHELKMAIVAMKVMGASILGHNAKNLVPGYDAKARAKLPGAAIRWVLQDKRVSMLNIGVSEPKDVDENIAVLASDLKFTNADRKLLADFAGRAYESEPVKKMRTV